MGQIEVDELYVGIDSAGCQYAIPVQAKGGKDELAVVQTIQDLEFCRTRFPRLVCRAVSAQFMSSSRIALFELVEQDNEICIANQRHYELVEADKITPSDLDQYRGLRGQRAQ